MLFSNMKQEQAIKEIESKWVEIVNIFKNSFNVNDYKIKTQKDKNKLYQIHILKTGKRNTSTQFVIKLNKDGKAYEWRSEKSNGAKALVGFIAKVGVEEVYRLHLSAKRVGALMFDSVKEKDKANYELIDGKYIFKKSENDEKITLINEIISRLHLNASVNKIN